MSTAHLRLLLDGIQTDRANIFLYIFHLPQFPVGRGLAKTLVALAREMVRIGGGEIGRIDAQLGW